MHKKFLFLLVLSVILSACKANQPAPPTQTVTLEATRTRTSTLTPEPTPTGTATPSPTPTISPTIVPYKVGPDQFPEDVNPLTGMLVSDPALLDRKPLAVKIQLFPRFGRPPFGINSADIVYEYYQNGGITRLHAIFYGEDARQVGPIRSARMPDHDLILMYKSIFAYGSADRRINNRLFNASYSSYLVLEGPNKTCPPTPQDPMCRFEPNGQNLLMTGTTQLSQAITNKSLPNTRPNLDGMLFELQSPQGGSLVNSFVVRFSMDSYTRWEYDPAAMNYIRAQDTRIDEGAGENYNVMIDRLTGDPVTAENVVIIVAPHSYLLRQGNSEIIEIGLTGSGKAYLFRDGQVYETTWGRFTENTLLSLFNPDGSRVPFKPGNTWFEIIGTSSTIIQPEDDQYRFQFSIP